MKGWIKLHRKFAEWRWANNPQMVALFIRLLIEARHEDTIFRGRVIHRGQLATSLRELSENTGISVQMLRTCLAKLELTNTITSKSTNKYRIITICKFDNYQAQKTSEQQANQQANQQASDFSTLYNEKEDIKNIERDARARILDEALCDAKIEKGCMMFGITTDQYRQIVSEIIADWEFSNVKDWTMAHLLIKMRYKVQQLKANKQNGNNQTTGDTNHGQSSNPLARAKVYVSKV